MHENPRYDLTDVILVCKAEFGVEDVSALKDQLNPRRPILAVMASLARELSTASIIEIARVFDVPHAQLILLIMQGKTFRSTLSSLYEAKIKRIIETLELSSERVRPIREKIDAIIVDLRDAIDEMAEIKILHP